MARIGDALDMAAGAIDSGPPRHQDEQALGEALLEVRLTLERMQAGLERRQKRVRPSP
ncbi:MAG: hypothetical protein R3E83_25240 [Burkholderiaceae bacterium]